MTTATNLFIDQGSDFYRTMSVVDNKNDVVDLTSYTIAGQLRKNYSSTEFIPFTIIVISAVLGKISIGIPNSITSTLTANRYVYDVEITAANGKKYRILDGNVTVTPNVTR